MSDDRQLNAYSAGVSAGVEDAYTFWIAELSKAFPDMKPFTRPAEFVEQLAEQIRQKENAALQRAINVVKTKNPKSKDVTWIRFCMRITQQDVDNL